MFYSLLVLMYVPVLELHPSIEDYYILWPDDLIDDVMNDDFLNWGAIADALLLDRIELEAETDSEKG